MFEYFTREEADLFTFYRMPKELFDNPKYKNTSTETKVLYGFLLDRNSLSRENEWFDEQGRIYIYFSREEVMERLKIGTDKVVKLFAELREVELIREVRQGQGKPNIIYVGRFISSKIVGEPSQNQTKSTDLRKSEIKNSEKPSSGNPIFGTQNFRKTEAINTEINYTEGNENQLVSQFPSQHNASTETETNKLTDELTPLYKQAQINLFLDDNLQELLKGTIKELYIENPTKVQKLSLEHIDESLARFRHIQEEKHIKNPKLYFKKCLLSAIEEVALINAGYFEKTEQPQQKEESGTEKKDSESIDLEYEPEQAQKQNMPYSEVHKLCEQWKTMLSGKLSL